MLLTQENLKRTVMIVKLTNFRMCREMSGFTQTEVAKLAGVTPSCVAKLEKEGCFCTKTAVKYAKVMKIQPIFLLDGLTM